MKRKAKREKPNNRRPRPDNQCRHCQTQLFVRCKVCGALCDPLEPDNQVAPELYFPAPHTRTLKAGDRVPCTGAAIEGEETYLPIHQKGKQ